MAQLTEAYLKKMIRQVLNEGITPEESFEQFEVENPLGVDVAVEIINGVMLGRRPSHRDLKRVIALLYQLSGRQVITKNGEPAYRSR